MWQRATNDLEFFLWGSQQAQIPIQGLVKTVDELDLDEPIKRLPDRPHLRALVRTWKQHQLLIVFKSRQLLVSWLVCAIIVWLCLKPGRRVLVVCKKFASANDHLTRMMHIINHLPKQYLPTVDRVQGSITFRHPEGDSVIMAASQNSDEARQFTFTMAWFDEAAFTDFAPATHAALTPTIQGGGRFLATTTSNGKDYWVELATDEGRVIMEDFFNVRLAEKKPRGTP